MIQKTDGLRWLSVTDLRDFKAEFADSVEPLLLLCATGDAVLAGPLYLPGASVCLLCARHQARVAGWDRPPAPAPSERTMAVAEAIAAEIAADLRNGKPPDHILNGIVEIDLNTGGRRHHRIVPKADCPRCGLLRSGNPTLSSHCSPLTGIVSSVTVTNEPFAGSYSAIGYYAQPLPVANSRPLLKAQWALGKGQTKKQAIESCIGEALERYSLVYTGGEPFRRARLDELPMIEPGKILLVSERQYEGRDAWNETHTERYWIPERFDATQEMDLLPGVDLNSAEAVWVPAACCVMWYPFRAGERRFSGADTVGCGAGRTFADAALSGLFEWVERDAMAIWWYNRLRRPAVHLESFESADLLRIRDALRRGGRELHLLDVTTDFGIPTYIAVSPDAAGREPVFAAAASLSPRAAALKAAGEAAQLIFCAVQTGAMDPECHAWLNMATLQAHTWLAPARYESAPAEPEPLTAEQQLRNCAQRLAGNGVRVVAVDQSSPDVLLKTVRIVAPGLRHIWARFAPGRLYEVPLRLGWVTALPEESSLNSILCMI